MLHPGSCSTQPPVLLTCCPSTKGAHPLRCGGEIQKFPAQLQEKKASDSESGPFGPPALPYCASVQKQIRTRRAAPEPAVVWLLRVTPRFHLKPLKPDMLNHHFSVFATSKKEKKTRRPREGGTCRPRPGPRPGFQVHIPQCSSLELRPIGGDAISISDRSISIQFGDPYLHNLLGSALRCCPRAFASNVHMETNLQILGEL